MGNAMATGVGAGAAAAAAIKSGMDVRDIDASSLELFDRKKALGMFSGKGMK